MNACNLGLCGIRLLFSRVGTAGGAVQGQLCAASCILCMIVDRRLTFRQSDSNRCLLSQCFPSGGAAPARKTLAAAHALAVRRVTLAAAQSLWAAQADAEFAIIGPMPEKNDCQDGWCASGPAPFANTPPMGLAPELQEQHDVLPEWEKLAPDLHEDAYAMADAVLELAHNCPSGAIQCQRPDGTTMEIPPIVNTVRVRENGPLAFHAELVVAGQADGCRATLCRCGASHNKPYCDGSHSAAGFSATGEPATQDSQPLAQRDGPLQVQPTHNGPLHVTGALEVVSGTGRTLTRVTEAWLCRCGQSANKPFCDGSHAKAGFVSGD